MNDVIATGSDSNTPQLEAKCYLSPKCGIILSAFHLAWNGGVLNINTRLKKQSLHRRVNTGAHVRLNKTTSFVARTHAHPHALTHACIHTHKKYSRMCTRTYVRSHERTQTPTHCHIHAQTHAHARTPTYLLAHTYTFKCVAILSLLPHPWDIEYK